MHKIKSILIGVIGCFFKINCSLFQTIFIYICRDTHVSFDQQPAKIRGAHPRRSASNLHIPALSIGFAPSPLQCCPLSWSSHAGGKSTNSLVSHRARSSTSCTWQRKRSSHSGQTKHNIGISSQSPAQPPVCNASWAGCAPAA